MVDSSVNCIINEADKLEKRKGLIRGLDERFAGAVCGLHAYTDECGREWLVVADQGGFSVRQPFAIPSFASSDAYPSDFFSTDGAVNVNVWNNAELYQQQDGALVLAAGGSALDLLWFKEASNFSYEITFAYQSADDTTVTGIIKAAAVSRLEARIVNQAAAIAAELVWIDASGEETTLGAIGLGTTPVGICTLSYTRDVVRGVFAVELQAQPTGEDAEVIQDIATLNAVSDASLGQRTGLRLERESTTEIPGVLSIQGAPI